MMVSFAYASSSNEDFPGIEDLSPEVTITSVGQSEIVLAMKGVSGERYSFSYSTDLQNSEWKIEGMTITIPNSQNIESESDRYTFTPTENEISITTTFTNQAPLKAFSGVGSNTPHHLSQPPHHFHQKTKA